MTYSHDAALKSETEMMNALRAADRRIAELEEFILRASDQIEQIYGNLSSAHYPGPPTLLVKAMREIATKR
jgi:uncharacterized protein (UPF0335 family)